VPCGLAGSPPGSRLATGRVSPSPTSLLLVLALTACGNGGSPSAAPSTTSPPVSPSHVTEADVNQALRDAATAEETYFSDKGTYTTSVDALAEQGFTAKEPIQVKVLSASRTAYCLEGTGSGITLYYSTAGGRISATRCT
jgi:hypothetical protein